MCVAEVASRLDAAVKAIDAIDGASFVEYLLGDFIVGTEMEGRGAGGLDGWGWDRCCRCSVWCRR
jgi:hypothetical protein